MFHVNLFKKDKLVNKILLVRLFYFQLIYHNVILTILVHSVPVINRI